ncbi:MAG TPA: tRNA (adenosine(37)-N6)-threonylcarbamoyltransferase complex transferase subunit TsaD [Dehalococcoidales bacterium]|nr:tRNA (adenosine(37)-N6)-threonylcarbamoyltransferase complex transferase subunit TsaD [Dehalococcoidales bacterium]
MKILGIETSCDETAASVVEDGRSVLSNIIASQIEIHARYGGVVPEVASRQHMLAIIPVIEQAMTEAGTEWKDIDAIAVTRGPGLAGSLLVGLNTAKGMALARQKPLIGVNHLEAHIYANWLTGARIDFPTICLIVSGGHSDLVLMKDHGQYDLLGRTRDDAAGEAFDKVARILGLGYPGGPLIQKAAEKGVAVIKLPHSWLEGTHDFSFSGIKTAVFRLVASGKINLADEPATGIPSREDAAASFQKAVVEVLVDKTVELARELGLRQILVAGGVAANQILRQHLIQRSPIPVIIPPVILCTDNAAMVAACAYFRFRSGKIDNLALDAAPSLKLA